MATNKWHECKERCKANVTRAKAWLACNGWFKYAVVIVLFFVLPMLIGEANIFKQIRDRSRIAQLKREIRVATKHFRADSLKLEEIRANQGGVEHTARELYYMKAPDETIFLVQDSTRKEEMNEKE